MEFTTTTRKNQTTKKEVIHIIYGALQRISHRICFVAFPDDGALKFHFIRMQYALSLPHLFSIYIFCLCTVCLLLLLDLGIYYFMTAHIWFIFLCEQFAAAQLMIVYDNGIIYRCVCVCGFGLLPSSRFSLSHKTKKHKQSKCIHAELVVV